MLRVRRKPRSKWLLDGGFEVRALGTTATERGSKTDPLTYLQSIGLDVQVTLPTNKNRREFRFVQRGIPYTLIDTGRQSVMNWEPAYGRQFDLLFDAELESFEPDIVFTYGGMPGDIRRHKRARLKGLAHCLLRLQPVVHAARFF